MNIPPDILSGLEQLIFQQGTAAGRADHLVSATRWTLHDLGTGLGIGVLAGLSVMAIFFLVYRPRLARGSFWMPVFGLFGGVPTLYLHTRPSSVCGFFMHSRRLRSHTPTHHSSNRG